MSSHHRELCSLGKEGGEWLVIGASLYKIRNTKSGPELGTGRIGHPRCSANDKVFYFSSMFYSLTPFYDPGGTRLTPGVLWGGWSAHLMGAPSGPRILLVHASSLQVALDRSGP